MNIKDFEYLVEIANQESISRAAARLYLSQPTLTKFLKKAEDEYGTLLFDRMGKRMVPTAVGQCCIEKAKRILEINDQMNQDIDSLKKTNRGYIRIGTSASRGEFFIGQILPALRKQYPDLNLSLSLEAKTDLMEKVDNRELDIIFVSNYAERPYLEYTKIAGEEMVLVVPKDHELVKKAKKSAGYTYPYVELTDWISYPFIMGSPRLTTGQYTRLLFQHYKQQPPIALEVGSLPIIYSAVSQNMGITIAPSMPLCQKDHQNLCFLSFEDEQNIQWYFTAITKGHVSLSPFIGEIIQLVQQKYVVSLKN